MADNISKLKNGMVLISTEVSAGLYNSLQLSTISRLCEGDIAMAKATEDQRIALFVKEDQVDAVVDELKKAGLGIRNWGEGLHSPIACIGELCPNSDLESLDETLALTEALYDIDWQNRPPFKIGMNGCGSCCVPSHTMDISLCAGPEGYRLCLGGKNSQLPELASFVADGIPGDKLVDLIPKVVHYYLKHSELDETLEEMIMRCGVSGFINLLAPYSQDAPDSTDPFSQTDVPGGDTPMPAAEVAGLAAVAATTIEQAKAEGDDSDLEEIDLSALDAEAVGEEADASSPNPTSVVGEEADASSPSPTSDGDDLAALVGEVPTEPVAEAPADDDLALEAAISDDELPDDLEAPAEVAAAPAGEQPNDLDAPVGEDALELEAAIADDELAGDLDAPAEGTAGESAESPAEGELALEAAIAEGELPNDLEAPAEVAEESEEAAASSATPDDELALEAAIADDELPNDLEAPAEVAEEAAASSETPDIDLPEDLESPAEVAEESEETAASSETPDIDLPEDLESPAEVAEESAEVAASSATPDDELALEAAIADDELPEDLESPAEVAEESEEAAASSETPDIDLPDDIESPADVAAAPAEELATPTEVGEESEEAAASSATPDDELALEAAIADDELPEDLESPAEVAEESEEAAASSATPDDELALEAAIADDELPEDLEAPAEVAEESEEAAASSATPDIDLPDDIESPADVAAAPAEELATPAEVAEELEEAAAPSEIPEDELAIEAAIADEGQESPAVVAEELEEAVASSKTSPAEVAATPAVEPEEAAASSEEDAEADLESSIEQSIDEEKTFLDQEEDDPNEQAREQIAAGSIEISEPPAEPEGNVVPFKRAAAEGDKILTKVCMLSPTLVQMEFGDELRVEMDLEQLSNRQSPVTLQGKVIAFEQRPGEIALAVDGFAIVISLDALAQAAS